MNILHAVYYIELSTETNKPNSYSYDIIEADF